MILIGKNLGERQKDLNRRVNETVAKKVNFDLIEAQQEKSDVDVFFKIDVAAKYKNTVYILKILKSEDVLHIERALKMCDWLYDEEHSNIVNPDYLHNNLFPHMSMKMKRKMLNTISAYIRDEIRAESFYNYCRKENFIHSSYKFLLRTSEAFKLEHLKHIRDDIFMFESVGDFFRKGNLKLLVGNSSALADAYLKMKSYYSNDCLVEISSLYFLSNETYLDILEKNMNINSHGYKEQIFKLSKQVTKDIAMKYKSRILMKPELYLRRLDMKTLVKHSSLEEVKQYAIAKLPNTAQQFWAGKYWRTNKLILRAIPPEKKFEFVKTIFTNKFPGTEFETSEEFYTSGTYHLMTKEQMINTSKNFENEKGKMSRIKRCVWYRNVSFETAFTTFEKVMVTNTNRKIRSNLLVVLIKASKTQQDLDRVINYYSKIFNSENPREKEKFLKALFVYRRQQIFDMDLNSWTTLQTMLLDAGASKCLEKYKATFYLCYILHNKEPSEELQTCLDTADPASINGDLNLLEDKLKDTAYEHLSKYHENKLNELEGQSFDLDYKVNQIRHHVRSYINLVTCTNKSTSTIPEIVQKYVLTNWEQFCHIDVCKDIQNAHYNYTYRLKKDARTVTDFHQIKEDFKKYPQIQLKPFLKRLKVYFAHDIAKDFATFFKECLSPSFHECFDISMDCDRSLIDIAVIGIYMLAEDNCKQDMILKYTPEADVRINYFEMDGLHLYIQEAICRFAYISRPRLPISVLHMYLRGDYAERCLPTISSLFANLTANCCLQMAQTLANGPKSSQILTFPLVFAYLTHAHVDKLKEIVLCFWRTGDKLARRNIFESIIKDIHLRSEEEQVPFISTYIEMVSTLRENDDSHCFELLIDFITEVKEDHEELLKSAEVDALEAAWNSVGKFRGFVSLKTSLIIYIDSKISLISKDKLIDIINEHIQNAPEFGVEELEKAKWDLAASYLVVYGDDTTNYLLDNIMTKLIHYIQSLRKFTAKLLGASVTKRRESYTQSNSLLSKMLSYLTEIESLDMKYTMIWDLRLAMISNKIMDLACSKLKQTEVNYENVVKQINYDFAKEIGKLVKEFINSNQYLESFVPKISATIREVSMTMALYLHIHQVDFFCFPLFLVDSLIDFDDTEIQLLAIHVLATNFPKDIEKRRCKDNYRALFDRMKDIQDEEIQELLNKKFSSNGIKRRRLYSSDSESVYSDEHFF